MFGICGLFELDFPFPINKFLMAQRFSIQQIISEYGTGQLARAVDSQTGLPVVVRVFKCASEDERHSLESLMAVLADLRHPNIEPVHQVVRDGSDLIIVTEEPEGETLSEVVAVGPLSVDEFRLFAVQVLGALSAAHQKGAVHGSINASRIRVVRKPGERWKVHVTGYGIGFGDAGKSDDLAPYLCVPPEQWEQLPARRRSDVYSMGCVFYQALSGRSPFDGKTLKEVRHKHVKHDLRPLEQLAPQAPAWLCDWVMSLLKAASDERIESATVALDRYRTAEASRNVVTQSVPLPPMQGMPAAHATGFVQVAGSAFFRVPNVSTQTVSIKPIDPLIHTARHAARTAAATAASMRQSQRPHTSPAPSRGKPLPSPARAPRKEPTPAQKSGQRQWIIIGSVAVAILGVVAFLMRGGEQPKGPIKVAANPIKVTSGAPSGTSTQQGNDLPAITGGYPTGRQKPVNYSHLVLHAMTDGGVISTRTDVANKRQPAQVNDQVFAWKDYAERGRDSSPTFPSNQGNTYPTLVSLKPDATFPLARERRFIRFSGEGSPGAALTTNGKNQTRDFPFGPGTSTSGRGFTFAVVFFQEVKGRVQTLFNLNSQHGSAVLRLGEKGDLRFNGRRNNYPENLQHPTLTISADKFNPVEPLLVTGVWRAEPAQVQLRVRSASGYAFQTPLIPAPVPSDALGNLLIGREGVPGPTATNKSTDAKTLRAFAGGIAELLIYSIGLNDGEIKTLEDQISTHYFPPLKS